jgi:hypothetical protein
VTLEYQVESVEINGKKYYIMDTPGFDTDKEQKVFREIIRGIEAVRPYAKIIGVMLVTRINDSRAEALDNKLVGFVHKFCGNDYIPQVTMVTTFWNVSEERDKLAFDEKLRGRLESWRRTLGQKLKHYQHGRRYQNGNDTGVCLRWDGDKVDIKEYVKEMVSHHYGNINPHDPQIVQELVANRPQSETAAGQFLGLNTADDSFSTPTPPSSSSSASTTSAPSPEVDDGNQDQDRDEHPRQQEWGPLWNVLFNVGGVAMKYIIVPRLIGAVTDGVGGGMAAGGARAFPNGHGEYTAPPPSTQISHS